MYNDLTLVLQEIISYMNRLVALYFTGGILSVFFAIFIVRKISKLLEKLF